MHGESTIPSATERKRKMNKDHWNLATWEFLMPNEREMKSSFMRKRLKSGTREISHQRTFVFLKQGTKNKNGQKLGEKLEAKGNLFLRGETANHVPENMFRDWWPQIDGHIQYEKESADNRIYHMKPRLGNFLRMYQCFHPKSKSYFSNEIL